MMISPHTNREVADITPNPVFWCGICNIRLKNPYIALQHMRGRPHRSKSEARTTNQRPTQPLRLQNSRYDTGGITVARKTNNVVNRSNRNEVPTNNIPTFKNNIEKTKSENIEPIKNDIVPNHDPNLSCDICHLDFTSLFEALQHYKGRKHASVMLATTTSDTACSPNGKHVLEDNGEPANAHIDSSSPKKMKDDASVKEQQVEKCEDCKMTFTSDFMAQQHFQGKKHAKTMAAKKIAEENSVISRWQGRDGMKAETRVPTFQRNQWQGPTTHNRISSGNRNNQLGGQQGTSDRLLQKAKIPGKLRTLLSNTGSYSSDPHAQRYVSGNSPYTNNIQNNSPYYYFYNGANLTPIDPSQWNTFVQY